MNDRFVAAYYEMVDYLRLFMSVVSVKVPHELKKDMEKRKTKINWSEEIRLFISRKIEEEQRRENLEKADSLLKSTRRLSKGEAAKIVREDRDSYV